MTNLQKWRNVFLELKMPVLTLAFFLFGINIAFGNILKILFETKVIWHQESFAVWVVWKMFQGLPTILVGVTVVFILMEWLFRNSNKWQTICWFMTLISCILALWWIPSLYIGMVFFITYLLLDKTNVVNCKNTFPPFVPPSFIVGIFVLFGITILICINAETLIKINPFRGKVFNTASFMRYIGLTISLSLAFALKVTIIVAAVLQVSFLALFLGQKHARLNKNMAVFLFLLVHAAGMSYIVYDLVTMIFSDEIAALELGTYIPLFVILPIVMICTMIWFSVCHMTSEKEIDLANPAEFYYLLVSAAGLFYFVPFARKFGKKLYMFLISITYIGALLMLIRMNYPTISDYSARFCLILSFNMIICVTAMIYVAYKRINWKLPAKALWGIAIAFLLTFPFGVKFYQSQTVRMIAFEYSKLSWAQLQLVELLLPKHQKRGFGEDTTFEYYPEEYKTFDEPPLEIKHPPIFIFLLDALRPDHTNFIGYSRNITPNMKKIKDEGIFFANAHSCATGTACSLRHLFTGHYSSRFMMENNPKKLDTFWIKELIEGGYGTFIINTFDSDYNGISLNAFKRKIPKETIDKTNFIEILTYDEFPKVTDALGKLTQVVEDFKKHPEKQNGIITYLHGCRPHIPWNPTKAVFGNSQVQRYDATIKEADKAVGQFFDGVKKLGLYDDAIIILLADHGTGLNEHGRYGGFLTYEEQTRIPLVIRAPGIKPQISKYWIQNIDIGPTLVNMVTNVKKNRFHGISLLGHMRGKATPDRRYTFHLSSFEDLIAIVDRGRYKLHYHRRYGYYKFYDLEKDPRETNNLTETEPELTEQTFKTLEQFLRAGNATYNNPYHYATFDPKD